MGLVYPRSKPPGKESLQPTTAPAGGGSGLAGGGSLWGLPLTFWSTMEQAISRTWARLKSPEESCSSSTGSRLSPIWRWKATPPPGAAAGGSGLGGRISGGALIGNFPPKSPPEPWVGDGGTEFGAAAKSLRAPRRRRASFHAKFQESPSELFAGENGVGGE